MNRLKTGLIIALAPFIASLASAQRAPALFAGPDYSIGLKWDGTLWTWGNNDAGQLGLGFTGGTITAPQAIGNFPNVAAAAGGGQHALAIATNYTVRAWGSNAYGQLGNNSVNSTNVPVPVGTLSSVWAVAAGGQHSLCLNSNFTVWAWGRNNNGQLGDGQTVNSSHPVLCQPLSNVWAIAAGSAHSLALKMDGTLWAWGYNAAGQLGLGNTLVSTNRPTPLGFSNILSVAAAGNHSLALKDDRSVWGWGLNDEGELGTNVVAGNSTNRPVRVAGLSNMSAIVMGSFHTVALHQDGTVWTLGRNAEGELGITNNVTRTNRPMPVAHLSNIIAIAAGDYHSLAFQNNGAVWAWGSNQKGQLGTNIPAAGTNLPVRVSVLTNWNQQVWPPATPSGASVGYAYALYPFAALNASSSWGRVLEYQFDWGNGITSDWRYASSASNKWTAPGVYSVRARARSILETFATSVWSAAASISIVELPASLSADLALDHAVFLPGIIGVSNRPAVVSVMIQNYGPADLSYPNIRIGLDFFLATNAILYDSNSWWIGTVETDLPLPSGTFVNYALSAAGRTNISLLGVSNGTYYLYAVVRHALPSILVDTNDSNNADMRDAPITVRSSEGLGYHQINDYDNDNKTDPTVFNTAAGRWETLLSAINYAPVDLTMAANVFQAVTGDFDGDGFSDPAVYAAATGDWWVLLSANGYALVSMSFGAPGYTPVSGDFDGDGRTDPAVYNEFLGLWGVRLSSAGYAIVTLDLGGAGYAAVSGDFDGDGKSDPAVFDNAASSLTVRLSASAYLAVSMPIDGGTGSVAVAGDFDGDGRSDPAAFNAATGAWRVRLSGNGYAIFTHTLGTADDLPVIGDLDGDGCCDPTVYHAATGMCTAHLSGFGYAPATLTLGGAGYRPVP